ncbi:hypothetical protein Pcinc_001462 [Petrolisthes cinctipes]|uniref:Uncharacterized protein n=1 Tax=Petrolisthes cinctipes TaxID=88211 RepID=A0AAE1GR89_PETCI|nr:hypothetical protein Pcinc_001462 [Petrolisthes cinctipes]
MVITETVDALCAQHILKRFIKFPPIEHLQQKKEQFRRIAGFTEVIGVMLLMELISELNIQLVLEDDPGHGQPPAEDNIQMAANDDDDQVEPPPY